MLYKISGVSGLVFVLMLIAATITFGDAPAVDTTTSDLRDYLADSGSVQRFGGLLAAFAVGFQILFLAGVLARIRPHSDMDRLSAEVARLGAVVVLVCFIVADLLLDVLFFRDGAVGLDDSTIRLLWDGQIIAYSLLGVGVVLLTGGVSLYSFQTSLWPRWHSWLGVVVALIALPAPLVLFRASSAWEWLNAFTIPALLLWSLVTAIVLLRGPHDITEGATDAELQRAPRPAEVARP